MSAKRARDTDTQPLLSPEHASPLPQIVPPSPLPPDRPAEQLLLIRTLELVQSIHATPRAITEGLREIKASLPVQRKPLSQRSQAIRVMVTATRRNGLCPCCQEKTQVCTESGRLNGAEFDHWYGRNMNRVTETWLICGRCNEGLNKADFKAAARSAFESYQAAVRPLLNRQMTFPALGAKAGE